VSGALFPGWRPDAAGQSTLARLLEQLCSRRPDDAPPLQRRRPDQWHATLCLVGYDLGHLVTPALHEAFADVGRAIPPHEVRIDRLAYWPQSGAVVALPGPGAVELQALCDATLAALRRQGIRPQQATTQPHVTLAYLPRRLPAQPWVEAIDGDAAALRVDAFELLFNPGGRYEALGRWTLSGDRLPQAPQQGSLL
jgi:2'-5' RNA ligase